MSFRFCINDEVVIINGKDKGKKGIIKNISKKNNKVIVENINLVFKHQKSIPNNNIIGGIFKKESWIHISNISHFCFVSDKIKLSKIGFKYINKKKIRYLKYNNYILDKK